MCSQVFEESLTAVSCKTADVCVHKQFVTLKAKGNIHKHLKNWNVSTILSVLLFSLKFLISHGLDSQRNPF